MFTGKLEYKGLGLCNEIPLPAKGAKELDVVTKPSHYQLFDGVEVRDVINNRLNLYFYTGMRSTIGCTYEYGNAIKYILRAPFKNGKQDLEKARFCIDTMIQELDRVEREEFTSRPA
jgi:hypothetical protein